MRPAGQFPGRQELIGLDRLGLAFYQDHLHGSEGKKAFRLCIGDLADQGFA